METQPVFLSEKPSQRKKQQWPVLPPPYADWFDGNSFADVICCCLQTEGPNQLLMHIGCVARRPTPRLPPPVT